MKLGIICTDVIQSDVLAGAAQRRGWAVIRSASAQAFLHDQVGADAVIVDTECADALLELSRLADLVGKDRLFVLTDGVSALEVSLESRAGIQEKPFHPTVLLGRVEASVRSAASTNREPAI